MQGRPCHPPSTCLDVISMVLYVMISNPMRYPSPVAHSYAGQSLLPPPHARMSYVWSVMYLCYDIRSPERNPSPVAHPYDSPCRPPSTSWDVISMISEFSMLWYQISWEIPAQLLILMLGSPCCPPSTCWDVISMISHVSMLWYHPIRNPSPVGHSYAGQSLPPLSTSWDVISMISEVSMLWYQIS